MTIQLDLFGVVEAAQQVETDWQTLRAQLVYDRILTGADLGYALIPEQSSGWPNGCPAGADDACEAAWAEQERGSVGERVPGAPGSCSRCDHPMIWHHQCRHACERCDCKRLLEPVVEHLEVDVLPGARIRVRTHAEVMTGRWARYGMAWPGAKT